MSPELLPRLSWPDDEGDENAWGAEWREAFKLRHGEAIASAARLAERMADVAKWAANAAAETPPLSLLRDLKDAAQSAIGEKTAWKLRAHEAEALVDSLVTTGEAAERATARDASAHEKALEAATQQTRDAETKADSAVT